MRKLLTEMKERPILMATDSVKAILDGRKTMTRRVIKPNLEAKLCKNSDIVHFCKTTYKDTYMFEIWHPANAKIPLPLMIRCPYGQVGDRLWVRETWWCPERGLPVSYRANLEPHQAERQVWKPSIFMPRWASRILLEITEVRAERLQEIEEHPEDYKAEGYIPLMLGKSAIDGKPFEASVDFAWYENLWDSLNAKRGYPWSSNPWVWVIEFKPTLQ